MADLQDVGARVKRATSEQLGVPVEQINDDSRFAVELGADSIKSIELVAAFEAEFDIEMEQDEALEVKNVGDAVRFIAKHLDEQGS